MLTKFHVIGKVYTYRIDIHYQILHISTLSIRQMAWNMWL